MLILTINAGSSSLRLGRFRQSDEGLVRLDELHYPGVDERDLSLLGDFIASVDVTKITLLVHRVVHGGQLLNAPCLIDAEVEAEIERLIPLAPLHNAQALVWIRFARRLLEDKVPQVAVFDTAFYQALPTVATTYALPYELCTRYGIRRYGFHGIAHRAMWQRWREIKPKLDQGGRVISVQLGAGCSITAIDQGIPVDTSMGFSPLDGLLMSTRSGDLDPSIITFLQRQPGFTVEDIDRLLNQQSGLFGLSGISSDMRVLLKSDNARAQLAVDLYCYRIRKYIGAYLAVLGGVDAILFGGGVGENSAQVRAKILQGMQGLGLALDPVLNDNALGQEARISATAYASEVWVVPVDEARIMALDALSLLQKSKQLKQINEVSL